MLSALHVALALGPLAIYLLVLGMINLSRRPLLTTGGRDLLAVSIALSGFFIIGPLDLFMPATAANRFGVWVWLLMLGLYLLVVSLIVLVVRPRLVIYNMLPGEVRVLLQRMIDRHELPHAWAGDSLSLPTWGIQLHMTTFLLMRNVSLSATGARQSLQGWRWLRRDLAIELSQTEVPPNPLGLSLMTFSLLMLGGIVLRLMQDPSAVARSLIDLLRL